MYGINYLINGQTLHSRRFFEGVEWDYTRRNAYRGRERVPTFVLSHKQVNRVVDEMLPGFDESFEADQFTWTIYMNNSTVIKEIFQKLQVMFARYKGQLDQSMSLKILQNIPIIN